MLTNKFVIKLFQTILKATLSRLVTKTFFVFTVFFLFSLSVFGQWSLATHFPGSGRQLPFCFTINGKAYLGCGFNRSILPTIDNYEFNPPNTWTAKNIPPFSAREGAFSFSIGNYGYVGSGSPDGSVTVLNDFWRYDPVNDSWFQMPDFPGNGRIAATTFVINGKAYVISGVYYNHSITDCWEFDPAGSGVWNAITSPPAGFTYGYGIGFSHGGYGYCGIGGIATFANNDFWRYDPVLDHWDAMQSLPSTPSREEAIGGVDLVSGKGFVGLGTGGFSGPDYVDFYTYDFANDQWQSMSSVYNFPKGLLEGITFNLGGCTYAGLGYFSPGGIGNSIYKFCFVPPTINCLDNQHRCTDPGLPAYTVTGNEFDPVSYTPLSAASSNDFNFTNTLAGSAFQMGNTTVTWTVNDNGNTASCSFVVTIDQTPIVSISQAGPFCENDPPVNLIATPAGGFWSGTGITDANSGSFDPATSHSGTHHITYSILTPCPASGSIDILVNPLPNPTAGSNSPVCTGDVLNLFASGGFSSYAWEGPGFTSGTQNPSIPNVTSAASGNYTVTVTDGNGCKNSATVTVELHDCDYGDAPFNGTNFLYPTLLANNGARHFIDSQLYLGSTPADAELNGQPDPNALRDDQTGVADENGIEMSSYINGSFQKNIFLKGSPVYISVMSFNSTGSNAYLQGWIDFNGNGNWEQSEKVVNNFPVGSFGSLQNVSVAYQPTVPLSAKSGTTYARFRLSNIQNIGTDNLEGYGEVEDYKVTILDTCHIDTLLINTGIHRPGKGLMNTGDQDRFWKLVSDPSGLISNPAGAFVIDTANYPPSWNSFNDSRWLGTRLNLEDTGIYIFEYKFCLNNISQVSLNLNLLADNSVSLYLNNNLIVSTTGGNYGFMYPVAASLNGPSKFVIGKNVIRVRVHNMDGPVGLSVEGSLISGNHSIGYSGCCDNWHPVSVTPRNPGCSGGSGGFTIIPPGGSPYYIVTISPCPALSCIDTCRDSGYTTPFVYPAGNYTIIVSDTNGYSETIEARITEPLNLVVTPQFTPDCSFGSIDLSVTGGTSPYSYFWSNGAISQQISGLTEGKYTVTVTDAGGCTQIANQTVTPDDTERPVIDCPHNISVYNEPCTYETVITYNTPVGTDNCPGATTVQIAGFASGSTFPLGTTKNIFKVTDASGNTATCSFDVTITDNPGYYFPLKDYPTTVEYNNPDTCQIDVRIQILLWNATPADKARIQAELCQKFAVGPCPLPCPPGNTGDCKINIKVVVLNQEDVSNSDTSKFHHVFLHNYQDPTKTWSRGLKANYGNPTDTSGYWYRGLYPGELAREVLNLCNLNTSDTVVNCGHINVIIAESGVAQGCLGHYHCRCCTPIRCTIAVNLGRCNENLTGIRISPYIFPDSTIIVTYEWSTGASTRSILATVSGRYSLTVTNNMGCTGSASTDVIIGNDIPLQVNVSIAASANPVCTGISATYTATPLNGGSMPDYQWKVNGINAGSNVPSFSYTPLNGDIVNCTMTSNEFCVTGNPATSNTLIMTVNTTPAPTGNPNQSFCNTATVADLMASGTLYQWYGTSFGGVPLAPSTALVNHSHYYASQTVSGCESAARFDATINIYSNPVNVSNNLNSGNGSLRDAVANVCNNGTITFSSSMDGQIISLTTGTLLIDKNITLNNNNHTLGISINGSGDNVTILPGKTLTLASESKFTITGPVKNYAGINGLLIASNASLIQNTPDLPATAQRFLNNGWHLFGSPFKKNLGAILGNLIPPGGSVQMKPYSNGINWGSTVASSLYFLLPTVGYAIRPGIAFTATLTGSLFYSSLISDYTIPLIYNGTAANQSWNLLANPYTSFLNWNLLGKINISPTLYLWDNSLYPGMQPGTITSNFRTYNSITNIGVPAGTKPFIAPFQGFFVKTVYTNPKLTFPPSARTHSTSNFYKNAAGTEILVRLRIETETYCDELVICRNQGAKNDFEEFDSEKLIDGLPVEIYSQSLSGQKLTINTVNNTNIIIPLGIEGDEGAKAKLTSFALETAGQIYLEDRYQGKLISLSENTTYDFEYPTDIIYGRFFIRFGDISTQLTHSDIKVFKNNNQLNIVAQTREEIQEVEVYSLTGACVFKAVKISSNMFSTKCDLSSAIYLVRVRSSLATQNVKISW